MPLPKRGLRETGKDGFSVFLINLTKILLMSMEEADLGLNIYEPQCE